MPTGVEFFLYVKMYETEEGNGKISMRVEDLEQIARILHVDMNYFSVNRGQFFHNIYIISV